MSKLSETEQAKILQAQRHAAKQIIGQAKAELDNLDSNMIAPPITFAEQFVARIVA